MKFLIFGLPLVQAWWDNGHMLAAEVARQQLPDDKVALLSDLLADWHLDFPGGDDLASAATWSDHIKCSPGGKPCRSPFDALSLFDSWHYANKPYDRDNLKLERIQEMQQRAFENPSLPWFLKEALHTLNASDTRFAFQLVLRMCLHVMGDLHQPLHLASGFFNDSEFGEVLDDKGGNLLEVRIAEAGGTEKKMNLHAFWDAAGGLYLANWPLLQADRADLRRNASSLLQEFPQSSFEEYDEAELRGCFDGRNEFERCSDTFDRWSNESFQKAIEHVYGNGLTVKTPLSASYIKSAQDFSRRQIALAGHRIHDLLLLVLRRLPEQRKPEPRAPAQGCNQFVTGLGAALSGAALASVFFLIIPLCRAGSGASSRDRLRRTNDLQLPIATASGSTSGSQG